MSRGILRAPNPKIELLKGFNCRDKIRGTIRCVSEGKVCNTENEKSPCELADPISWAKGERVLNSTLVNKYTKQFGGDFAEDPEMGIFGRADNVKRHKETYDIHWAELVPFTIDEIKSALLTKGITIPKNITSWDHIRKYALDLGITPDDIVLSNQNIITRRSRKSKSKTRVVYVMPKEYVSRGTSPFRPLTRRMSR